MCGSFNMPVIKLQLSIFSIASMNFVRCLYFSSTFYFGSDKLCSVSLFMWWEVYV